MTVQTAKKSKLKKTNKVKLVAIAKDEAPYIPQWIYHHLSIGIDLIEIHINNTTDNSLNICKKIAKTEKKFVYIKSDKLFLKSQKTGKKFQLAAYKKSLRRSRRGLDCATHILFLDLDEYLVNKKTGDQITKLIDSSPEADAFSFLWYFEHWNQNKKNFSDPICDNTIGIRNNHVKSLIKISRKLKSCGHHNALFKKNYVPINFLSDTKISIVEGINSSLNRAVVSNDLIKQLDKEVAEGWNVLHCVYRSHTEYLASLMRARAHNNHTDPIKNNRWGLKNPGGQIINLGKNDGNFLYKLKFLIFLTKHQLHRDLYTARNHLSQRKQKLDELLKRNPKIITDYPNVFRGTMYDTRQR